MGNANLCGRQAAVDATNWQPAVEQAMFALMIHSANPLTVI